MPRNSGREPEVRVAGGQERCGMCRRPVGPSGLCKPCDAKWLEFWEGKSPARERSPAEEVMAAPQPITLAPPSKAVRKLAAAIREPIQPAADERLTGARVRAMRNERGWSQAELARRSGVATLTVQSVEYGRPSKPETRKKIAAALNGDLAGEAAA